MVESHAQKCHLARCIASKHVSQVLRLVVEQIDGCSSWTAVALDVAQSGTARLRSVD
jgi:hypothetical protein